MEKGFGNIVGQHKARKLLGRSLMSKRLPHAFLFKGPDGVGKKLFAKEVARLLNCRDRRGLDSCLRCASCVKFASDSHPDFLQLSPEKGTIKIASIRELCTALTYPPYESLYRVVVLEDVHSMRSEAANALLKTLEEPQENNIIILTADASREILPTIVSRCQVISFFPLTFEETAEIITAKEPDIDKDEAFLMARLAEGSPGKAMLYKSEQMFPLVQECVTLLTDVSNKSDKNVGEVLKLAEKIGDLKENLPHFFNLLRLYFRDIIFLQDGLKNLVSNNKIFHGMGKNHQKHWSYEQLFAKLQAIDKAEKMLQRNCNKGLVCEVLLFSLQ